MVAIVDDECRFVDVEVRRRRGIVEIVIRVEGSGVLSVIRIIDLLVTLAEGLGRALEGLLDLLLALLIQEGLELRIRGWMGSLLGLFELLELIL